MKKLFALSLVGLLGTIGCSSSPAPASNSTTEERTAEVAQLQGIPEWVLNIPSEPGQAFYGVGTATYKNQATMDRAFKAADAAARRQIADTMKTTIKGATKSYARQILTDSGEIAEESLSQDVTVAVTNFVLMGAAVVKRDAYFNKAEGLTQVYSLSRVGFDAVAESLHQETSKAIEKVQKNAQMAFDDLDRMLKDEQEKNSPYVPPPSDLPAIQKPQ
jgi:hypothetical protein